MKIVTAIAINIYKILIGIVVGQCNVINAKMGFTGKFLKRFVANFTVRKLTLTD